MKTVKVLILGGEAVGVVDGGCELVEVPVVGGKESELGFKPGFLGAVNADLGSKGLDHMKVPFEGGVPVGGLGRLTQDELYRVSRGEAVDVTARFGYEPGVPIKIVAGGAPVTVEGGSGIDFRVVDYKAEVRAYVDSVPEGGFLIPGYFKSTGDGGYIHALLDGGGCGFVVGGEDEVVDFDDYKAAWYFLRLDLKAGGVSSPAVRTLHWFQEKGGSGYIEAYTWKDAINDLSEVTSRPRWELANEFELKSDTHTLSFTGMLTSGKGMEGALCGHVPFPLSCDEDYDNIQAEIVPKQNL